MTSPLTTGPRPWFLAGVGVCAALIAAALYFQHVMHLDPCPLCILQRLAVIALGVVFIAAAIHNPGRIGLRIYAVATLLAACAGAAVSSRHLWLQNLPADQVPACGPGLDYILETFPPGKAFELIFRGSGECAEVAWTFLGISIPGWTLLFFIGFAGFALFLLFRRADGNARSVAAG